MKPCIFRILQYNHNVYTRGEERRGMNKQCRIQVHNIYFKRVLGNRPPGTRFTLNGSTGLHQNIDIRIDLQNRINCFTGLISLPPP